MERPLEPVREKGSEGSIGGSMGPSSHQLPQNVNFVHARQKTSHPTLLKDFGRTLPCLVKTSSWRSIVHSSGSESWCGCHLDHGSSTGVDFLSQGLKYLRILRVILSLRLKEKGK